MALLIFHSSCIGYVLSLVRMGFHGTFKLRRNLHKILTEEHVMKHLSMDFPGHEVVSNIFALKEGDIINEHKVVRKPSRFIYMPLLPNEIDPSPTNNSLYEMPVFILE